MQSTEIYHAGKVDELVDKLFNKRIMQLLTMQQHNIWFVHNFIPAQVARSSSSPSGQNGRPLQTSVTLPHSVGSLGHAP